MPVVIYVLVLHPPGPWSIWMYWWNWIPGLTTWWHHEIASDAIIPTLSEQWYSTKWPLGGAITEMDHQLGLPIEMVVQGVGNNGQHLGGKHGIKWCWNKVLGQSGTITQKENILG